MARPKTIKTIQESIDTATPVVPCISHIPAFSKHQASMAVQGMKIKSSAASWQPRAKHRGSARAQWLNHTFNSATSVSKTSNTCEKHIENCKVGAADWLVQNFELNKAFTSANYQIQHQADADRPKKVVRTTSIMEPSWIKLINHFSSVMNPTD